MADEKKKAGRKGKYETHIKPFFDKIDKIFKVTPQRQALAEQVDAFECRLGADELPVGVTYQIEVGDQHGQKEQNTDQTELHAEAEAIH